MADILIQSLCYAAVIFLGAYLRRRGFFTENAFPVISKIVVHITLPAALISSASGRQIDLSMLGICLLGLAFGLLYILLALALHRRQSRGQQAFALLTMAGYNIGTFAMPFTQGFLGPTGVITTSLFDVGNAFICLGGAYGVAAAVKEGQGFRPGRILAALGKSLPFLTHLLMVTLNLLGWVLPAPVLTFSRLLGSANPFLAMLMLGVGIRLEGDRHQLGAAARILIPRYALAALLSAGMYFLLPFPLEVRQTLVILAFSPLGSMAPIYCRELGEDVGLCSAINSISIVCSIFIMMVLLMILL